MEFFPEIIGNWLNNKNKIGKYEDYEIRDYNGLSCNCRCPACQGELVAKKGDELDWHFAHYNSEMCTHPHPHETVLHKLAKQIILDAKKIWLPKISLGLVISGATILIKNAS